MGIEYNGVNATFAIEDDNNGKSVGVVCPVLFAHVSPGASGDSCVPLYAPTSETTFSLSALDNVSP